MTSRHPNQPSGPAGRGARGSLAKLAASVAALGLVCVFALEVSGTGTGGLTEVEPAEAHVHHIPPRYRGIARNPPQKRARSITPSPGRARDDKSRMFHQGCQAGRHAVRPPKRCVYGDRGSRTTAVLVGDSHALHYFPAVEHVAKQRGWRLLARTKVGCPPIDTRVFNMNLRRGYPECQRYHRNLLRELSRPPRPDVIITSGWMYHTAMRGGERLRRDSDRNRTRLRNGYVRLLQKFAKHTPAHLVVMKDNPWATYDVAECVSRSRQNLRRCSFVIRGSHNRQSFERSVVNALGNRASLINLTPVFCPDRRCHAVVNGVLTYRDSNHLTASYSRRLGPPLNQRMPRIR